MARCDRCVERPCHCSQVYTCAACGKQVQVKEVETELACGDIWCHQHGCCVVFSLTNNPAKVGNQFWRELKHAWVNIRDNYPDDDWKRAWNAHFKGKDNLAAKLWRRHERSLKHCHQS